MSDDHAAEGTKQTTLGFVINWILCVLFIIDGGTELLQGTMTSGLLAIFIGLVLPPLSKLGGFKFAVIVAALDCERCRCRRAP